jgi:hypothetical protein
MSWRNEWSSVYKSLAALRRMAALKLSHRAAGPTLPTLVGLVCLIALAINCRTGYAQPVKDKTESRAATSPPTKAAAPTKPSSAPLATPKTTGDQKPPGAGGAPKPAAAAPAALAKSPKPPGAEPAAGPVDAATYVVRLRDLESRIDELKEQIRRSHTRLSLLSDTILSGGIGGAEANIVFRNEMSNAFRVVSVLFVLDGAVMKKEQDDTGELAARRLIPVYEGTLTPGDHTLQVVVVFQGHGYGVFSYLRAHKYTTKHTHSFTVKEGKQARIEATAYEKGGVTTPIDQRPNVRFTEKIVGTLDDAPAGAE